MAKEAFENSLRLTKLFLLLSGIRITRRKWRKSVENFFDYYLYYISLSWLYTDVCGELNWLIEGILTGKSFIDLSLTAPCITISMLATSKSIFLYWNRDVVAKIVDKLRDIHPEDKEFDEYKQLGLYQVESNEPDVEKEIVEESRKFLSFVVHLLFYICAVVICAFPLMPVTSMAYDYYTTGSTECKYPYLVKYFFDPYTMKMWIAVYFHHVVSTAIVGANVFGSDSLFYVVCIYIQMHFQTLCHRCECAVVSSREGTRRNVANAVKRHQELIDLVNQVELLYSKSTLFNIVTSSVLICLCSFIITVLDEIIVVVTFATFLVMNLSQISLLCYFGDILMRSSTEVSSAVYNSLWYETDQSVKKSMLVILMRAQKPCKLTAWNFADLNLTAFTTILSRSWSYFALLKTMYK
uniref:Odorant receptor n=1 Tax=Ostrinia furnacalis TaxID=93504 RepID=A0A0E4B3V9_OSTFU|nr:putative olfactory receptor 26 [Ostrinia furnacalis]